MRNGGRIAVALTVLAALTAGSASVSASPKGDDTIVIGYPIGLTGSFSSYDLPIYEGAKIAVADINAAGGVNGKKLELVAVDSQSVLSKVPAAAQQVIDKGAKVVVPTCDYDNGGPAARIAISKKILVVGCAGDPLFGKQGIGPLAFNVFPPSPVEAADMAQFAIKKGWKKAYLLTDTTIQYTKRGCEYVEQTFKHLGGTIVGKDTFLNSDASIAPQVSRLRGQQSKAQVLFVCSYVPGVTAAVKQLRAGGITLPMVGQIGADARFIKKGVPNLSNFYYPALGLLYGEDVDSKLTQLGKKYKAAGGSTNVADWTVISGYAEIQVIAAAIRKANGSTDATTLMNVLQKFKDVPVAWGKVTYTGSCHTPFKPALKFVQSTNGKLKVLSEAVKPTWVPAYPCNGS